MLLLAIALLLAFPAAAQISRGGAPLSKKLKLTEKMPTESMPAIDLAQLQAEDKANDAPGKPYRFAYGFDVNLNLKNSGSWEELADGSRIWRLKVACRGALSINFLYDDFYMPPGATFFIYTPSQKQILGAFGEHNNKPDRMFATALLYGDEAILEYYEPARVRGQGALSIFKVNHGYRGYGENNAHLGASGNCQVNVNCSPEGDNWQVIKKSVAKYTVNGNAWCSGALINTTANDCRAYFLTANHCAEPVGLDAINSPTTGNTLVFYWNFERPGCDNTGMPPQETTVGATILANPLVNGVASNSSDFALFQLSEDPTTAYHVYFAGWNATGATGTGGVGIHHPAGDAKKIATHSITPTSVVFDRYWRIYWDQTPNGWSVTEGGSSGSPLFNSSGIIIGQLFGGFLGGQPNCSDPADDEGDYGKLSYSWTNNGASDARRRLNTWLDPVGGGTITSVSGRTPCGPGTPANDICSGATPLSCGGMATGSTALATDTDASNNCGGGTPDEGVWFTFTGNGQIATINTTGSNFDTQINIYEGGCGNLSCIGGNDDINLSNGNLASSFTFCTQNGVAYYVYLDGFLGATGNYQISLSCAPDTQAPSISCPSNVTVNNAPGLCGANVSYPAATATDNCTVASITYSQNSGTFFPVGATTVAATATDATGNFAGCSFSVTVVDNEDPIAACLNNTVYLQADGMYTLKDVDVLDFANSSDNCSFTVTGISPAVVDCDDFDTTVPVLVTITDPAGNSDSCTANVYVDKSYALPAPWSANNIGNPGPGNAYQYDPCLMPPKFFINAGAANNSITSDNLAFINQTICGNFNITAKIESISANGWAGLLARESSASGSRMIGAYSNLGSIVRWESRAATNGNKAINLFSRPFPYWLRLIRQGNTFLGYYSTNGTNFSLISIQTLALNNCLEVGLAAFTSLPGHSVTAVFSNVSAGSGVMPLIVMPGNTVDPTGLDRQQAGIRLFPNPAQELVTLEFPSLELLLGGYNHPTANAVTLRLRNELGQLIEERRLDELPERLDWHINTLKPGMYFIEVHTEGQAPQMLRFVKVQ